MIWRTLIGMNECIKERKHDVYRRSAHKTMIFPFICVELRVPPSSLPAFQLLDETAVMSYTKRRVMSDV